MSEARTVKAVLTADVSGLVSALGKAEAATKSLAQQAEQASVALVRAAGKQEKAQTSATATTVRESAKTAAATDQAATKAVKASGRVAAATDQAATKEAKASERAAKAAEQGAAKEGAAADQSVATAERGAKAAEQTADAKVAATEKASTSASDAAAAESDALEQISTDMIISGAALTASVGAAVTAFATFDAALSQAKAGTVTAGETIAAQTKRWDEMSAAAIQAGARTQFSATEAAQAITAMGKAGVSTADILHGGLDGALALAAAGQLEVGTAAEIAATSMVQFGLSGKDIPHIADILAAGASKAMGSVEDLSGALKYAGVVAASAGWSIEETTGVLAEFAHAGIVGEQAGTSLRGVISAMQGPSAVAAKEMGALGMSVYDAQGHFLKAAPLAGELHRTLSKLSEADRDAALATLFGNEQLTAARVLYEGGAGAVQTWTKGVNDAGFAAKQAGMLTDNLQGDIERLGGSLSSALITSGSGANDMLRNMTKWLQIAVDGWGALPTPVQQGALAIAAVTGATLVLGGSLIKINLKIAETKLALADMGRAGAMASAGMTRIGTAAKWSAGPLMLGVIALGAFAVQASESKGRVEELSDSLDKQTGAITLNTRTWVTKRLSDSGVLESGKRMGIAVADLTDAALGNDAAMGRVTVATAKWAAQGENSTAKTAQHVLEANNLKKALGGTNSELDRGIQKNKDEAAANKTSAAAKKKATDATVAQTVAQVDLTQTSGAAGSAALVLGGAVGGVGEAAKAAEEAVKLMAKNIQQDMDAASSAFMSDMDVIGGYDPQKQIDAVASASEALVKAKADAAKAAKDADGKYAQDRKTAAEQKQVEDAQQAVADAAGGNKVADAKARQSELEARLAGKRKLTVSDRQQQAKAQQAVDEALGKSSGKLGEAEAYLADLEAKFADKHKGIVKDTQGVDSANQQVKDAQAALDKARADQAANTLEAQYKTKIEAGKKFVADLAKVTKLGLDPEVIARLLKEGPTKAAPALKALLGGNSKTMIAMVNDGEKSMKAINERVIEQARLTSMAINSSNDQMTKDFSTASQISSASAAAGGKATAQSLAKELHLGVGEVKRIAREYGIGLRDGVAEGVAATKKKIATLQARIDAIKQGKVPGISANTAPGQAMIRGYQTEIDTLHGKTVPISVKLDDNSWDILSALTPLIAMPKALRAPPPKPKAKKRAEGGSIRGPGTGTSDSIPAMLSHGEYVVKASSVAAIGVPTMDRINATGHAAGGLAGDATFGAVLNAVRFSAGGYAGPVQGTSSRTTTYDQPVNIAHATFTDGSDLQAAADRARRQRALGAM